MDISTGDLGASYELFVAAELIQKGFDVFRNLSPNGPADLVVYKDGHLLRVQVKGRAKCNVPVALRTFDVLATYSGGPSHYAVPRALERLFFGSRIKSPSAA